MFEGVRRDAVSDLDDVDSDIGSPIEYSIKGKVTGGVTVTTY